MAVTLSLFGGAGWQFFDDSGRTLSGGKIYTYAAGTTTPQVTYTSRSGTVANANPIVLDAAGRTPQQIWSVEGLLYKYVIETSTGTLIRTWDNIGGSQVSSDLAVDLASTTDNTKGDALIGFKQSNASGFVTGATARTVNDKLQESVSVKDFGAIGDGVADDTAAIQAAIDYVIAQANLGTGKTIAVHLNPGTYKITTSLRLFDPGTTSYGFSSVTLVGEALGYVNSKRTVIVPTFVDKPALILQQSRNAYISGFSIVGSANNMSLPTYAALLDDSTSPWWNTNSARDSQYSPYCGIAIDPFGSSIPSDGGYPGLSSYYKSSGGSTGVIIDRVEIAGFIVGVATSTSGTTPIGDSILVDNCNISYNKVALSAGQSQNRGLMLRNCHLKGAQVVVDNTRYGEGTAAMPMVEGGVFVYVKWFINSMDNGRGGSSLSKIYVESFWSLGFWGGGRFPLQITGCVFKFIVPATGSLVNVDSHFYAGALVYASGTYFGQYSNTVRRLSIVNLGRIVFSGCTFDGEPQFSNVDYVRMDKCSNAYASNGNLSYSEKYSSALSNIGSGSQIQGSAFCVVEDNGPLNYIRYKAQNGWDIIAIDSALTITAPGDGSATFTTANVGKLQVNDYLTTISTWNVSIPTLVPSTANYAKATIGRVASIVGTTVTLSGVPISFATGSYIPYLYRLPVIRTRTFGTTTSGSADITSVTPVTGWTIGARIASPNLPTGTYITNIVGTTFTVSQNATASSVAELYDTRFAVDMATRNAAPTTESWIRGDFVRNYTGSINDANNMVLAGWICTVTGSPGTWSPVYWSSVTPAT